MLSNECKLDCTKSMFKRLNFFHGMLLSEQDFLDEQAYFREKLKMHNRLLHGHGVVAGLELESRKLSSKDQTFCEVFIKAGAAISCNGDEIVVCREHPVGLKKKIEELDQHGYFREGDHCSPPEHMKKLYVGISYCECKSDPAPQYTSQCGDDQLYPEFSRIREGFTFKLFTEEELPPCPEIRERKDKKSCCQPEEVCEGAFLCPADPHYVILGCIEILDCNISDCSSINVVERDHKFYPARYHLASHAAHLNWASAKYHALSAMSRSCGWHDVSIVIGKSVEDAKAILERLEFTVDGCKKVTDCNLEELLDECQCMWPFAKPKSTIELICDESGGCVVFPYVIRTGQKGERRPPRGEREGGEGLKSYPDQ
jgi:hypothetical protein